MTRHVSILLPEIVESLAVPFERAQSGGVLVDCTLGGGGHTAALLERLTKTQAGSKHRVVAVDQDATAIEQAQKRFSEEISQGRLLLIHSRFSELRERLTHLPVLGVLADLGFSSDQIDEASRGFSFRLEGPLDMRLDPARGHTARTLLATETEAHLAKIIWELGEERFSRKIARRIVEARSAGQLPDTTTGLAALVASCFPPSARQGRTHPATRTFQALRIWVNDELSELKALLESVLPAILSPGGRAAILSFHSLEDRMVKQAFARGNEWGWRSLQKKPIEPSEVEIQLNPRSRSAKLRIAEWINERTL
jgi:16S rRNA (cytosine1402-N4)-methyltransferase